MRSDPGSSSPTPLQDPARKPHEPSADRENGVERHLRLEGVSNFRDMGGYPATDGRQVKWRRLFRSGALGQITSQDIEALDRIGIRTVIDLRCPDERELVPTPWDRPAIHAFGYPFEAVFAKALGSENWSLYENYLELLRPHFRATLKAMLEGHGPLVVHCSAGQDRTGVVAAVVLSTLGVSREHIVEDYMRTTALRQREKELDLQRIRALANQNRVASFYARIVDERGVEALDPRPLLDPSGRPKILLAFETIEKHWGSAEDYLIDIRAMRRADIETLRSQYLEDLTPARTQSVGGDGPYTVTLDQIGATDLALVGGKGANLGELVGAGLPVPSAFCVTTHAYDAFVKHNALRNAIAQQLSGIDCENVTDLARRATAIREQFMAGEVPPKVRQAIEKGYAALSHASGAELSVSVRSSATAEDLPGASFAGQQDTYLHVQGVERVVEHVKQCWASLWTDRAISYRERQDFAHDDVSLAVVVQEMFPSEVSGVMFTANPVTSNPNEVFINSSWGLGESVVSGKVNPDQHIVDKSTRAIVDQQINDKVIMTSRRADGLGVKEAHVPADKRTVAALDDAQLVKLVDIGLRVESHYGIPQDIEWGFSQGRFAVLQSREITAADLDFSHDLEAYKSQEALADMANERWTWTRAWSDEFQTGPSTPWWYSYFNHTMTYFRRQSFELTDTLNVLGFDKEDFDKIPMFRWYGARAYMNVEIERERTRLFQPPFARDEAALWTFPASQREEIRKMAFNWPRFLQKLWDIHLNKPHISLLENHQVGLESLAKWKAHEDACWKKLDLKTASAREMTDLQFNLRIETGFAENICLAFTIYLLFLPNALKLICRDWLDDENGSIYSALSSGLGSKTSEENIALWRMAQALKKTPELEQLAQSDTPLETLLVQLRQAPDSAEFVALFDAFIETHGHRGGAERDAFHRRYRHEPYRVLLPVRSMMRLDGPSSPEARELQNQITMRETRDRCIQKLRKEPLGFLRAPFFAWFVELVQQWLYYRDFERFYNEKTLSRPREWLSVLGRRFVDRGLLSDPEDIFFLGKEEVIRADEGQMSARDIALRIRSRRRVYERYTHQEPPKYIRGWKTFDDETPVDDGGGLRGTAASGGAVKGRARVCRQLQDIGRVRKGDILVTVSTDPAWTTVFAFAGGIVVETGGVVAHAVMISREYGIPCVSNLTNACERIPDNALVSVDGTNGIVVIHDETEDSATAS